MSEAENNTESQKAKVLGKINEIKSNIESFISDVNVNELKSSLNVMMKDAQKDFNKLVDKDLENLKKKFQTEKSALEKKAKKFLDSHKKELTALQVKFEKLVKASAKKAKAPQAAATASGTKKKVNKKVAKVAKKVAKKVGRR